jgi:hypothetical protein
MDSAFFSDEIVGSRDAAGVKYTVSVPFERLTDLKARIEARRFWWRGTAEWGYFQGKWKPKAWKTPHRFQFIRTRVKEQHKEPIQLDLFVPHDYDYEFKVILTKSPWCPQDARLPQRPGQPGGDLRRAQIRQRARLMSPPAPG